MKKDVEKILVNREKCTGCAACLNVCPTNAIKMKNDKYGFEFPSVDKKHCINCMMCVNVCENHNFILRTKPIKSFAASNCDKEELKNSASGGAFMLLAKYVIRLEGVVFGAAWIRHENNFVCEHICVENSTDLYKLQGSKYVQSRIGSTFENAKQYLEQGRSVLFSGTPCQIAGLKAYLRKDYDNLLTVDVICHGTPNVQFFSDSIRYFKKENNCSVKDLKFRDKLSGWNLSGRIYYEFQGKYESKPYNYENSVYYKDFLDGISYRVSCYSCEYANPSRVSDITIGDFWGSNEYQPELIRAGFSEQDGISCCLVNSEKALLTIDDVKKTGLFADTKFDVIVKTNKQLLYPSILKKTRRNMELIMYRFGGCGLLETIYTVKKWVRGCLKSGKEEEWGN